MPTAVSTLNNRARSFDNSSHPVLSQAVAVTSVLIRNMRLILAFVLLLTVWSALGFKASPRFGKSPLLTLQKSMCVAGLIGSTVLGPISLPQLPDALGGVQVVHAADSVIYKSGKTPEKFKNKDPNDKKGTRKEGAFLRCLSNCKTDCQKPRDGLAALDCNQDCQDQCCESYEQCSFKIRTRSTEI